MGTADGGQEHDSLDRRVRREERRDVVIEEREARGAEAKSRDCLCAASVTD